MIENLSQARCRITIIDSNLGPLFVVRHWSMSSLSNQGIKLRYGTRRENLRRKRKEHISVVITCFVGNDCQHARARRDMDEGLVNYVAQLAWRKVRVGRAGSDERARWFAGSGFQLISLSTLVCISLCLSGTLCLCGKDVLSYFHHRDTESTETQRLVFRMPGSLNI